MTNMALQKNTSCLPIISFKWPVIYYTQYHRHKNKNPQIKLIKTTV
jgi:hypothetical protein